MRHAETRGRVYELEAINTMGRAFEKAVRSLSEQPKKDPNIRRQLAAGIMRLFDEGERAPLDLSLIALSIIQRPASKNVLHRFIQLVSCSPRTLMDGI